MTTTVFGVFHDLAPGVRDPEFKKLPPSVQGASSGTRYETLRMVYDEVTVDDMKESMDLPETASNRP
jgi:hypothetical protein